MNLNIFQCCSLKTRVTLFTLVIFVLGIWSLAFYASLMLHEDMERLLGEQQFSTASFMAAEVDGEMSDRLKALEKIAGEISPAMLGNAAALQSHLEQRPTFQSLFNDGTFVTRIDGAAIADTPLSAGRHNASFIDRDFMIAALRQGKTTIGRPAMGERAPIFYMAAPIRDPQARVTGALIGVTDLSKPNFLDKVTENRYARTGGYLLIAPQHRLIITASDKNRIMEALPAPGKYPLTDRFLLGYEGSGIGINPRGVEILASAKRIPVAGWHLLVALPTAEAFAPIRDMQRHILVATLFLTLLAGGLTWWMLRRQLSPMLAAMKTLSTLSNANQSTRLLPITRQDEIGELIESFNHLLETLAKREQAQEEALGLLQNIAGRVPGVVYQYRLRPDGSSCFPFASHAIREIYRVNPEDVREDASCVFAVLHAEDYDGIVASIRKSAQDLTPWHHEYRVKFDDGAVRWLSGNASPQREADGGVLWHGFITDVTERKQSEQKQHQLSEQINRYADEISDLYENAPCGYHSLDKEGCIQHINRTELKWLGYTWDEVVGKLKWPDMITAKSQRIFRENFPLLKKQGFVHDLEIEILRKDGTILPVLISATAVYGKDGEYLTSRSTVYDMTERKVMEQERSQHMEQLEKASRHLVATQENARRRLSSELHDRTSPNLAAIDLNLNIIAAELPQQHQTEILERLEDTRALVTDTAASIRDICTDMRPPLLDYAGLTAALESYIQQFTRRTGIAVQFDYANQDTRYPADLESLLFRIFQEALTNCAKHARATSVIVTLGNAGYPIALIVADDGIGFDSALLGKTGPIGLGILNMREMAEIAGGKFTIASAPGKGTRITVEISRRKRKRRQISGRLP